MSIEPLDYRQLLPEAVGEISGDSLLDRMFASLQAPEGRPYTVVNFVASADGQATFKGRSGGLGDEGDHALFHGLRERVDAVFAGPVTMEHECYGRMLGKAERRRRRLERGLTAEPLACLVSRSGHVPTDIPLFSEPEARVVVFVKPDPDLRRRIDACPAQVELRELPPSELTLTTALGCLRIDYGVRMLLCEGGPTVFGALLAEALADELFLTIGPKLTGGGHGPAITSGPELAEPAPLRLRWLLEREQSLFARYAIGDAQADPS